MTRYAAPIARLLRDESLFASVAAPTSCALLALPSDARRYGYTAGYEKGPLPLLMKSLGAENASSRQPARRTNRYP